MRLSCRFSLFFLLITPLSYAQNSSSSSEFSVLESSSSSSSEDSSSSESSESSSSSSSEQSSSEDTSSEQSSDSSSSDTPLEPVPMPEDQTCEEERDDAYQFCLNNTQPNTPDRVDCDIQKLEYDVLYCPCKELAEEWCKDQCKVDYANCKIAAYSDYEKCLLNGIEQAQCQANYNMAIFNQNTLTGCNVSYFECKNPPPPPPGPPMYIACSESSSSCSSSSSSYSSSSESYSSSSSSSYPG